MVERIKAKPRPKLPPQKRKADDGRHSSRVSTGRDLLPSEDGRSVWARIMRDTLRALITHCGGDSQISDTQRMAARRIAALESELIAHEDRIARIRRQGKEPPSATLKNYAMLAHQQLALSKAIGWDRHAKPINAPTTLDDHIAAIERAKANGHHRNGRARPMTIEHEG